VSVSSPLSGLLRDQLLACGVFPGQYSNNWPMNLFAQIALCGPHYIQSLIIFGLEKVSTNEMLIRQLVTLQMLH
jgi:hypothetical protein